MAVGLALGLPFLRRLGGLIFPALTKLALYAGGTLLGKKVEDTIGLYPKPPITKINCLESTGAQTISNANIANGAVVVNAGTAVGTATAGVLTFTAGTISQVQLDGVMTYVCEEGAVLPLDVSGSGNHITSMTTTWTTSDDIPCWNALMGFYVAVQQTAPYIPSLADGSGIAANGLALTNRALTEEDGGHNGGEYSVKWTVNPTKATFDGTAGDKLTVAGLTGADVVTTDGGTAVLTAGTGEITATAGTVSGWLRINGEKVYNFSEVVSASTSSLPSYASWPDATIVATSLWDFWTGINTEFVTWDYADFLAHVSGASVLTDGLGDNLVVNGGFDADSDWTKGAGWTIGSGIAAFNGGAFSAMRQDCGILTGKVYEYSFDYDVSSGDITAQLGDGPLDYVTGQGTYSAIQTAIGGGSFPSYVSFFSSAASVCSIDNISVREVLTDVDIDAATYLQWWNPDGPCIVNRLAVFMKGYVLTDAEKAQAKRWSEIYGSVCGAGVIVPFMVQRVGGDTSPANETPWLDINGEFLFVNPPV